MIISLVSQKGGVGKSTLARLIAREYANSDWRVLLADLDHHQGTSYRWHERRKLVELSPQIEVEQCTSVRAALKRTAQYDMLVIDGRPYASRESLEIAKASDLVILPTGTSVDDLEPTSGLAHELKQEGVDQERIAFALMRIGDSELELAEASSYLAAVGYFVISGVIPERTAYRRASDTGRAVTETSFPTLNEKADQFAQAVMDRVEELTN